MIHNKVIVGKTCAGRCGPEFHPICEFELGEIERPAYYDFSELFNEIINFDIPSFEYLESARRNEEKGDRYYLRRDEWENICPYTTDIIGLIQWLDEYVESDGYSEPRFNARILSSILRILSEAVTDGGGGSCSCCFGIEAVLGGAISLCRIKERR